MAGQGACPVENRSGREPECSAGRRLADLINNKSNPMPVLNGERRIFARRQ
jgi:hypothetical protein